MSTSTLRRRRRRRSSLSEGLNEKTEAIKVCVRICPRKNDVTDTRSCITIIPDKNDGTSNILECSDNQYVFDKIFDASSSNEKVYKESGARDIIKVRNGCFVTSKSQRVMNSTDYLITTI